mgnify:CR=1 FL=1
MAGYFLSVQEQKALYHDVPPLAQRLYVLAIRPRMDKKTKLVGVNPKVSWRAFCEWLEFKGVQGIKKERPTESAVRRAAVHLEKVGMVENRSEGRQLIFFLPLSVVDFSLSKKADRLGDSLGDSMKEAESPVNTGGYVDLSGIGEAKADEEADTHHTVLNCTVLNNTNAHASVLTAGQWMEVFVVEFQYRPADIHTPSCVVLFEDWYKRKITLSTVRPAFQMAVAQLGQRPDNPVYLRKFVDDYVRLSNRTAVQLSPVPLDAQRVWLVGGDAYVVAVSLEQAEEVYQATSGIQLTAKHQPTLQFDDVTVLDIGGRQVTVIECLHVWNETGKPVPAVMQVISAGTPNA